MGKQVITEVRTFKVEEVCPQCTKGYLRPHPKKPMLMTNPPLYPHLCTEKLCGHEETFMHPLPALVYRDHEDEGKKKEITTDSVKVGKIHKIGKSSKDVDKKIIN